MSLNPRCIARGILLGWSLFVSLAAAACADETPDLSKAVQGKWLRRQTTAAGVIRIVKEHNGQRTIVIAYDEMGNVVYSHESEYTIEQTGKVAVFSFSNRTITAGPNAGRKIKEPSSFAFRVFENRFIEVHGILEGDSMAPNMILWERLEDADRENKGKSEP